MNWMHGYYAETGYTFGYYPETMPLRLHWASLIQGQSSKIEKFRYLDAGCGQGFNLIMAAAAHPDAEFVGVDFLPDHIAHGRKLAEACGLDNVSFIEGDFVSLAEDPLSLGMFDYVVSHGISTWIAPRVRASLFKLVEQVLNPGGLYYNSYNTFPGWLGVVPFQHTILLEQKENSGSSAIDATIAKFNQLKTSNSQMFNHFPGLEARLKGLEKQDRTYLAHEYNNQDWQPVFVSQMMEELSSSKLSYLGTATLPETSESFLEPSLRDFLSKQPSTVLREQFKDYALNQSFRRDLYVKGFNRPWPLQKEALIKSVRFVSSPIAQRFGDDEHYKILSGSTELQGNGAYYNAILAELDRHPDGLSVDEMVLARKANPQEFQKLVQTLTLLLHGGWVWLRGAKVTSKTSNAHKVNGAIAKAVNAGAPYKFVSLPLVGSAQALGELDWHCLELVVDMPLKLVDAAKLQEHLGRKLAQLNRHLVEGGKPVTDPSAQQAILAEKVDVFLRKLFPLLKKTGAL